jgi:hypothetical protein
MSEASGVGDAAFPYLLRGNFGHRVIRSPGGHWGYARWGWPLAFNKIPLHMDEPYRFTVLRSML